MRVCVCACVVESAGGGAEGSALHGKPRVRERAGGGAGAVRATRGAATLRHQPRAVRSLLQPRPRDGARGRVPAHREPAARNRPETPARRELAHVEQPR